MQVIRSVLVRAIFDSPFPKTLKSHSPNSSWAALPGVKKLRIHFSVGNIFAIIFADIKLSHYQEIDIFHYKLYWRRLSYMLWLILWDYRARHRHLIKHFLEWIWMYFYETTALYKKNLIKFIVFCNVVAFIKSENILLSKETFPMLHPSEEKKSK